MRKLIAIPALAVVFALDLAAGCGGRTAEFEVDPPLDAGALHEGGPIDPPFHRDGGIDASTPDASTHDASHADAAPRDSGRDVDNGDASTIYPAFHPDMPQALNSGGPTMTAMRIVPITFAGDPLTTSIDDFSSRIGPSSYWSAINAEYGLGAASSLAPIHLAETAPASITDDQIQAWLAGKLDGTHPEFPAPTPNTLYAIFYPAGTSIDLQGFTSCQAFGGYHYEGALPNATTFSYAVMPRCANFGGLVGLDVITLAGSHELDEAATDPLPLTQPAYQTTDDDHFAWGYLLGGEVGDLCITDPLLTVKLPGTSYTVQRQWSNSSARAWHDPCVPIPAGNVYFNAAPVLPDSIPTAGFGPAATKGVKIPVGTSRTIEVELFSDGPTNAFTVQAFDGSQFTGQGQQSLSFAFDRGSGKNGEKLNLTIKALSRPQEGFSFFVLVSRLGNRTNYWPGVVGH